MLTLLTLMRAICNVDKYLAASIGTFITFPLILTQLNFVTKSQFSQAQIHPYSENGLHLWKGTSKHSLAILDAMIQFGDEPSD